MGEDKEGGMRNAEILLVVLVALFSLAMRCGVDPNKPNPPLPPDSEDVCGRSCENLGILKCPGWQGSPGADESFGTPDDIPCAQVCRERLPVDPDLLFYHRCMATAGSCEAAEACYNQPPP